MPASTPGLRAKWRVDRAIKSKRPILPEDLELMKQEGMEIPENLLPEELSSTQSIHPAPIPLPVNLNGQEAPLNEKGPSLRDTVTGDRLPTKKLSKNEKACAEFYATEFGPLCVLVLWIALADLDKASFYAPSPDECKTASVPLARLTARAADKLNVPDWVGDAAVSVIDLKDLGFAAVAYLERIGVMNRLANYYSGMSSKLKESMDSAGQTAGSNGKVQGNSYVDISKLGIGQQYRPI
jgi:hypothetical protein